MSRGEKANLLCDRETERLGFVIYGKKVGAEKHATFDGASRGTAVDEH